MAFRNELISESDSERFGFRMNFGYQYWTRDSQRDYYLRGGIDDRTAYGEMYLGRFDLYINGVTYNIVVKPGVGSVSFDDKPFLILWDELCSMHPSPQDSSSFVLNILKEALTAYGYFGQLQQDHSNLLVRFNF
jgi:hypothetical protein